MTDVRKSRVLIIATDGFEQSELFGPREALLEAGAEVILASNKSGPIQGMRHHEKGDSITPDTALSDVDSDAFDALLIPGGVANPDALRMEADALRIVRDFFARARPVAAICHGPWVLAEAGVLSGRRMTSWPSIRTDLRNAGAEVVDEPVVIDGNLITSRKPDDVPAFSAALIRAIEAG